MIRSVLINWKDFLEIDRSHGENKCFIERVHHKDCLTFSIDHWRCYPNSSSSSCSSSSSFSSSSVYFHQCSKCQSMISTNELVMRTDDKHIYHIDCFTCCLCNVLLKPGDDYGLHGSLLFCRLHSEQTTNTTFSLCSPIKSSPSSSMTNANGKKSRSNSTATSTHRKQRTKLNNLENNSNNIDMTGSIEHNTFARNNSIDLGFLSGTDLSANDGTYSSTLFNNPSSTNPQQRTKRNRTSFKHHQLRIMKTFFAQNHNPDSKGLKILSQKTQLSKRVLQVRRFWLDFSWRKLFSNSGLVSKCTCKIKTRFIARARKQTTESVVVDWKLESKR